MISISPTTFAGATTAISILAGFRLNASYGRYREGRQYWSVVNTATRDLARQSFSWIHDNDDSDDSAELKLAQTRMLRLCQAYPVALLFHVNDKGGHHNMRRPSKPGEAPFHDRVLAEFRAELEDVYNAAKENSTGNGDTNAVLQKDLDRIVQIKAQGGNAPLEVITCMGEILALCHRRNVNAIFVQELDRQVQRLCKALGSCERIAKTPLPTGYSRHSSRLLFIWSHALPFALYPLLGPFGTLPTSLLTVSTTQE
jgi:putative membrane protein